MAKASRQAATPKSAFQQAAAAAAAQFDEARSKERKIGGGFTLPDIDDGEYAAKIMGITCGIVEKEGDNFGKPAIKFDCVVVDHPDFSGTQLGRYDIIKAGAKSSEADAWDRVLNQLFGCGYEIPEDITLAQIEGIAADATANNPLVRVKVKNGSYTPPGGEPRRTLNIDFVGPLSEEDETDPDAGYADDEPADEPPAPPVKASPKKAVPKRR